MEKKMEKNGNHQYARPEEVLDGHDMNQDLHQLIGYVWAEGNQRGIFPSEHLAALGAEFLRKYRAVEIQSPKAILNNAHTMKRLANEHRYVRERLQVTSDKLHVHEHYMNIIQKMDRTGLCGQAEDLAGHVEGIASSMEQAANEYLKKPESFDDIEDSWDARGEGSTGHIQPNLL